MQLIIYSNLWSSGAHIISGNVLETRALDELLPDWKEQGVNMIICLALFVQEQWSLQILQLILSNGVFNLKTINSLQAPVTVPVSKDKFLWLTENHAIPLPSPFQNHGNFVIRWHVLFTFWQLNLYRNWCKAIMMKLNYVLNHININYIVWASLFDGLEKKRKIWGLRFIQVLLQVR